MNFLDGILTHRVAFAVVESMILWSALTIGFYALTRHFYRRFPRWWTAPLIVAPILLIITTIVSHTSYTVYINGTHWLIVLLGPATVAFAVPIYEQRKLIRRYWPVLTIGVVVGSSIAILSSWGLATLLGLDGSLRLSLLPRSVSTPFAMTVSGEIGGIPELTAVFVILTGVFGAAFGESMLYWMPMRSVLARGALFGMGAHVAGSNKAHQINRDEGAIAGLVMVFAGIFNVLAGPLLAIILRRF
jgi:predicted murein hydrolase (TIGR00659 family)